MTTIAKARPRSGELDALEDRTSEQLVTIIDILLGLTLVEGALAYKGMFTHHSTFNSNAMLAMILVYATALWSFVDWHIAMQVVPYRLQTYGKRATERARFALDFALMASYAFLILRAHALIADEGADLLALAIAYPAIYFGYLAWGWLRPRDRAAAKLHIDEYSPWLLGAVCVLSLGLFGGYLACRGGQLGLSAAGVNTWFLALELALVVLYRTANAFQQVTIKAETIRDEPPPARDATKRREAFKKAIADERATRLSGRGPQQQLDGLLAAVEAVDHEILDKVLEAAEA